MAFLIAAYRHYLKYKTDDKGNAFEVSEPWMTSEDVCCINSGSPIDFLGLSAFKSTDLKNAPAFTGLYSGFVERIKAEGAMSVIESLI